MTEQNQNLKWYALRVVTGKERKTKELLEAEIRIEGIQKWVSEVVIPMEKEFKIKDGKKQAREKMTFPGYLLINAVLTGEAKRIIKNCNGVAGFTTEGGRDGSPVALRQSEVDRILGRIEEQKHVDSFIVGEKVKILDGPFVTFSGHITEVISDKNKVKVDVLIFGRHTPVDLSMEQIEKDK